MCENKSCKIVGVKLTKLVAPCQKPADWHVACQTRTVKEEMCGLKPSTEIGKLGTGQTIM